MKRTAAEWLWVVAVAFVFAVNFSTIAYTADVARLRALAPDAETGPMENALAAGIRAGDDAARVALEQQLVEVALDPQATVEGRFFACRALRLLATERTAAALAPLLANPVLANHARLTIEGIASPVADLALIAALGKTDGDVRRGIIASLAARETGTAVVPLTELATRGDDETAVAAVRALAAVARDARDANLIAALPLGDAAPLLIAQQEAFFTALDRLSRRGAELDSVVIPFPKMQARTAEIADLAVGVMLRINPKAAVAQIIAMLQTGELDFQRRAAAAIVALPDAAARSGLVAQASDIPQPAWPLVLAAVSDHGGDEILPMVRIGADADDEAIKVAALAALGHVGDASDAPKVIALASAGGEVGHAAVTALTRLPDRGADAPLIAELETTDSPVRGLLPDVIAARDIRSALPALLQIAATAERRLAAECYDAAGRIGDVTLMPELWTRWEKAAAPDRLAVERALVAIARRDDSGASTQAITARWKKGNAALRAAVIRVAGGAGDQAAIDFLRSLALMKKPDEVAIRTLAAWRTKDAFPVLRELLEAGKLSESLRQVVWNGMFDVARDRLRNGRWEAAEFVEPSMQLAWRTEDCERVLAAVSAGESDEQLQILEQWTNHAQLGGQVMAARDAMRQRLGFE
jgi:hypothetical protein